TADGVPHDRDPCDGDGDDQQQRRRVLGDGSSLLTCEEYPYPTEQPGHDIASPGAALPAAGQMVPAKLLNSLLMLVPSRVMAAMQGRAMGARSRRYSASEALSSLGVTYLATNFLAAVRYFGIGIAPVRR